MVDVDLRGCWVRELCRFQGQKFLSLDRIFCWNHKILKVRADFIEKANRIWLIEFKSSEIKSNMLMTVLAQDFC